jgi:hypothetical protein
MFSFINAFINNGRHGCGSRWCYSCTQASVLWRATAHRPNMTHLAKHFHGICVDVLNKTGLKILAQFEGKVVDKDGLVQLLTIMFGALQHLDIVADMFIRLHKGMHSNVQLVETVQMKGVWQKQLKEYTLYDLLAHCANLKGEGECHMGCPFHNESLLVHLIAAAVFAAISAMHVSEDLAYASFVTALFHDCGKPASRKADVNVRYPGHGLLGAICLTLFRNVIASTMPETMNPMDRVATVDAMIRTVQIHMALHNCGNAEICHKVLAHEDHLVRILASHMYVGDNLGKIRSGAYQEKVPFDEAYGQFIANMKSLPVHTSLVALNPGQKVSILLQGMSGSGKSS